MSTAVRRSPLVLMYHGVGRRTAAADPYNLFVPAEAFRGQMVSLLRRGWRPLDLDGFLAGPRSPRSFLVTFDDGYTSVRDDALPVLSELGVPAVLFVCPGLLGERSGWMSETPDERLLDADGLNAVARAGVEIGGHGWDHAAMTGLDATALHEHTEQVAAALAETTGVRPRAFAYPYGSHDVPARTAVAGAGYAVGFATHDGGGPMAVPRVDVNALDTARSFRIKTWAGYPAVRRTLGTVPGIRSRIHRWVGVAPQGPR